MVAWGTEPEACGCFKLGKAPALRNEPEVHQSIQPGLRLLLSVQICLYVCFIIYNCKYASSHSCADADMLKLFTNAS